MISVAARAGAPPSPAVVDPQPAGASLVEVLSFSAGYNTSVVLLGTTLLGLAAGIVGVFALLRKRALVADALSHATLPGVAVAFLLAGAAGAERSLAPLLIGAATSALLGAWVIHLLVRTGRLFGDAAIGIVLSTFFGAGVVLMTYIQRYASGGAAGLEDFLYGQTASMSATDSLLIGGVALLAIILTLLFLKEIALVCFNESFAQLSGWPVKTIDGLMMALTLIVIVVGLPAVGLLLVVALLIIPGVAARFWTDRMSRQVLLAGVIGALSGWLGAGLSALSPRLPAGAVIVLAAGSLFLLSWCFAPAHGLVASGLRRFAFGLRMSEDHLLEAAFELTRGRGPDASFDPARWRVMARARGWPDWYRALVAWWAQRRGFVKRAQSGLRLSEGGWKRGARIARNHRLWEQYLLSHADVAPQHVDWSVDRVEHVLSGDLVVELEAALRARGIALPAFGSEA